MRRGYWGPARPKEGDVVSKYEGHTPEPWSWCWDVPANIGDYDKGTMELSSEDRHACLPVLAALDGGEIRIALKADAHLLADAPKILRQRDRLLALTKALMGAWKTSVTRICEGTAYWPEVERVIREREAAIKEYDE